MNQKPEAYSFIRLSNPQDDSIVGQLEASRNYAEAKGFNLDESLTLKDDELSDSSGSHKIKGVLESFIEAAKNGKVPKGSLLIIERLDLLSREEMIAALNLFGKIIENEISIVTLSDGMEYNRETINDNVVHISRQIIGMLW